MRPAILITAAIKKIQLKSRPKSLQKKDDKDARGFTLIEVIISLALVTVVFVSLAQLFTLSIMQNLRSHEISNAIFLAQQQIDYLRTLTSDELNDFPNTTLGESNDERIDINADGTIDFRRLTQVQLSASVTAGFDVMILVFPPAYQDTAANSLITNPEKYKVRAYIHTIVSR
ncbi:MAG: prepilin-type N-terminal cleavage/methylation domain-containing protein [Candidatus Aminicenantales bacterium]|jgi:prepilin-type N-terminal cleavage/methylation domain-containing protein|nr:prepilin-type N-terminal cleavage/methylation domain-containing protein [Acidobacteriota bacterium]